MSDKLRITFTGGDRIGDELSIPIDGGIVVGRSHSSQIRVGEADVSGKHLEIVMRNGVPFARNLSRFGSKVDGCEIGGEMEVPIRKGSVIEIGSHVRFRIDSLPKGVAKGDDNPLSMADATCATRSSMTMATAFGGEATIATRAGILPPDPSNVAEGCVEESATRDAFSIIGAESRPLPEDEILANVTLGDESDSTVSEPAGEDAKPSDDAATADNDAATADLAPVASAEPAGSAASAAEAADTQVGPDTSASMTGGGSDFAPGTVDQLAEQEDEEPDGETQELRTRVGSLEEILERKHQLERKTSRKHWRFGGLVAMFLALLVGIWFLTASRRNVTDVEGPFKENGEEDRTDIEILNSSGDLEIFLEFPRDDRMEVVWSADSNQVDIATFMGRDRDVPFRLFFSRTRDASELQISLVESFVRWMEKMKDSSFSFATYGGRLPEIEFFEKNFDGWMQNTTQCGVPYVRSEYTRTVGQTLCRGMAYRFRSGDMVYCVCSEIPEAYWKRGGYRIRNSPFFGLYSLFINAQWDSPGKDGFVEGISEDDLVAKIRHELTANGPRNWPTLERWIDTLVAKTWGANTPNAKSAMEYLDEFLRRKTAYYNERKTAFDTARLNGDNKRMRSIFDDCRYIFTQLKKDRRYYLVNDPEEWECQESR